MKIYKVNVYKDRRGEWRWRVRARNGNIVANSGEGYKHRRDCTDMARNLFHGLTYAVDFEWFREGVAGW